jgi:hypothetical protein
MVNNKFTRLFNFLFLFLVLFYQFKAADSLHSKLKTGTLYVALGASFAGLNELWYKSYKSSAFHVFDDSREWYQMDKLGHFWTTYHFTQMALQMPAQHNAHKTINALSGFLFLSAIEVLDGYSSGWGFSKSDMLANALGCISALTINRLQRPHDVYFKFGFRSSVYADQNPKLFGQHVLTQILKDYNGQTYWLSYSLKHPYWPSWLALSLGYGIDGFTHAQPDPKLSTRVIKFSVDINPKAFQSSKRWIKPFIWFFTYVKFPFPVLAYNGKQLYLL